MKNSDMPAMPITFAVSSSGDIYGGAEGECGLTKLEQACIQLGVPETGDAALDDIILKSERKRIASIAMQGLLASGYYDNAAYRVIDVTSESLIHADALLEELSK